jgi:retinol dehydrogenase 12
MPWGRLGEARKDIVLATMSREDGGTGRGKEFWEWVDDQIKPFLS